MRETGILSIVKQGHLLQIRYASLNPYDMERLPYECSDVVTLLALLDRWQVDAWTLQRAIASLRKDEVAVVSVALSEAQLQVYFPPDTTPQTCRDTQTRDRQWHPPVPDNTPGSGHVQTRQAEEHRPQTIQRRQQAQILHRAATTTHQTREQHIQEHRSILSHDRPTIHTRMTTARRLWTTAKTCWQVSRVHQRLDNTRTPDYTQPP